MRNRLLLLGIIAVVLGIIGWGLRLWLPHLWAWAEYPQANTIVTTINTLVGIVGIILFFVGYLWPASPAVAVQAPASSPSAVPEMATFDEPIFPEPQVDPLQAKAEALTNEEHQLMYAFGAETTEDAAWVVQAMDGQWHILIGRTKFGEDVPTSRRFRMALKSLADKGYVVERYVRPGERYDLQPNGFELAEWIAKTGSRAL